MRAATRVNAEQASKRTMCRPTRLQFRGRLIRLGEMSEDDAQPLHRGTGGQHAHKESARNTGSPKSVVRSEMTGPTGLVRDEAGRCGVAERFVAYRGNRVTLVEGRTSVQDRRRTWRRTWRLGNLSTPPDVQKLPMASRERRRESCPRAGCGNPARPVRWAGVETGATAEPLRHRQTKGRKQTCST